MGSGGRLTYVPIRRRRDDRVTGPRLARIPADRVVLNEDLPGEYLLMIFPGRRQNRHRYNDERTEKKIVMGGGKPKKSRKTTTTFDDIGTTKLSKKTTSDDEIVEMKMGKQKQIEKSGKTTTLTASTRRNSRNENRKIEQFTPPHPHRRNISLIKSPR